MHSAHKDLGQISWLVCMTGSSKIRFLCHGGSNKFSQQTKMLVTFEFVFKASVWKLYYHKCAPEFKKLALTTYSNIPPSPLCCWGYNNQGLHLMTYVPNLCFTFQKHHITHTRGHASHSIHHKLTKKVIWLDPNT